MRILNLELPEKFIVSVHDFHMDRWIIKVFKMPNDMTGEKIMWHYEVSKIKGRGLLRVVIDAIQKDKDNKNISRLITILRDLTK